MKRIVNISPKAVRVGGAWLGKQGTAEVDDAVAARSIKMGHVRLADEDGAPRRAKRRAATAKAETRSAVKRGRPRKARDGKSAVQ
jgi:hypothetical protein